MRIIYCILVLIPGLLTGYPLLSQTGSVGTTSPQEFENNIPPRKLMPLYKGTEYLNYAPTISEGHPFFETGNFVTGSVIYEGVLYENVPLIYDIVLDELILEHYDKFYKILLNKADVSGFSLNGFQFIHIISDSTTLPVQAGFYNVLHDGNVKLLARRMKTIQETSVHVQIYKKALSQNSYVLKKNGEYIQIKTVKAALKHMEDKSDEVRQHLRKSNLNFRRDKEEALIEAIKYYDQISE